MAVAVGEGVGLPADPGEDRRRCYAGRHMIGARYYRLRVGPRKLGQRRGRSFGQ
jgi:hypothetical protein